MESNPTWMAVVALALRDKNGLLLLQQRPAHKTHGGLWEFPGGKVESGENPREALCREIAEELGIIVEPHNLQASLVADETGSRPIVLILYTCTSWSGEVTGREGQKWGWYHVNEAAELALAPLDVDLLHRLKL